MFASQQLGRSQSESGLNHFLRPSRRKSHYIKKRRGSIDILLLLLVIVAPNATASDLATSFCQSMDESKSTQLDLRLPATIFFDVSTVRDFVETLRRECGIPLSFIEHDSREFFSLPARAVTLDDFLRAAAERQGHYRCEILAGRLVFRSSDSTFDLIVSGVDLVEEPRLSAQNQYIDHLQDYDRRFESWAHPFWAGNPDSPVFDDPVTLTPRAPLVQHLVQLMGRDEFIFFDIPAARQPPERFPLGARTINIYPTTGLRASSLVDQCLDLSSE
jgi:hypothetical protein